MNFDFTPAHLHLMLNHVPTIGIAMASFVLFIGVLAQSRTTIATGLLATILCAAVMPTLMESGSKASHAFKDGSLLPPLDEVGRATLHLHANRADKTTPVIYASALLALLALLTLLKFPKAAKWLSAAVLLGNGLGLLLAIWTAEAGGRIRHIELRSSPSSEQLTTAPVAAPPLPETTTPVMPATPLENTSSSSTNSAETSLTLPTASPAPSESPSTTPSPKEDLENK